MRMFGVDVEEDTLPDDRIWITRDGRKVRITQMDDQHLRHTVLFLARRGYAVHASVRAGAATEIEQTEAKILAVDQLTFQRYLNMVEELKCRENSERTKRKKRRR